jgi:Flp pilus assembly protein TadD
MTRSVGPGRRALVWGVGSGVAVMIAAGVAWRSAGPEPAGSRPGTALARSPDDLDARLDLARRLLDERDLAGVWNETRYVLDRSPGHPRALAYQALVLLARGQGEAAVTLLRQALDTDPDLLEAHQNLVYAYARLGRVRDAEAAIAETSRRFPAEGASLKRALDQFTAMAGEKPVASHGR